MWTSIQSPKYSKTVAGIELRTKARLGNVEASYPYSMEASFAIQLLETDPIRPDPRDHPRLKERPPNLWIIPIGT